MMAQVNTFINQEENNQKTAKINEITHIANEVELIKTLNHCSLTNLHKFFKYIYKFDFIEKKNY